VTLAERLLRPKVAWPLLLAALIILVLLTPTRDIVPFDRTGPLTTVSTTPAGARGLYDVAKRLGWPVSRRREPFATPVDSSKVYLVLDPPDPLSAAEAHAVVDAVRRGAGLVYVASAGTELDDSLHVRASFGAAGTMIPPVTRDSDDACPPHDEGSPMITWGFTDSVHLYSLDATRAWPDDTTIFVFVHPDNSKRYRRAPAAVGFPLGAGRVVVLSDPDLLRNDVIRVCHWGLGVTAARMLEYASAGRRTVLAFDEYHFSSGANWWAAAASFLSGTAPGHAVAQIAVAGLILLVAAAWRPVAPVARARIERRSALEHVEALARAYARVGATRTAVRRLVRGLKRRHGRKPSGDDDVYLSSLAAQNPRLAGDVRRIAHGLDQTIPPTELLAVGRAVDHIDKVLGP
jgi:uncharacterized protein DUF4350